MPVWRYVGIAVVPAEEVSEGSVTEALFGTTGWLYAAVTGEDAFFGMCVPRGTVSDDDIVRLDLFATSDSCCVALPCLLSVLLLLFGMRLDRLR